jgi:hypothetical protein
MSRFRYGKLQLKREDLDLRVSVQLNRGDVPERFPGQATEDGGRAS